MRATSALALALTTSAVSAYSPDQKTVVAEALLERERIFPGWNQTTTTKKATTTKTLSSLMYKDGGSCDRKCGGYSGGCWCDAICHQYKDCCHDKCAFCSDHAMWGSTNYCLVPPDGVCQDNCYTPMPPPKQPPPAEASAPACAMPSCKDVDTPTSCEDLKKEFDPITGCAKTCNVEDKMKIMSLLNLTYCMAMPSPSPEPSPAEASAPACAMPSCKDVDTPTSCEDLKKEFDPITGCAKTCNDEDQMKIMSLLNLTYCMPMPSPGPTDFPSGDFPSGDFPSGDYVQPVRKTQVKAANALQPEPTVAA